MEMGHAHRMGWIACLGSLLPAPFPNPPCRQLQSESCAPRTMPCAVDCLMRACLPACLQKIDGMMTLMRARGVPAVQARVLERPVLPEFFAQRDDMIRSGCALAVIRGLCTGMW